MTGRSIVVCMVTAFVLAALLNMPIAGVATAQPLLLPAPAQPAASLPADLVTLEQKMATLHFNTERQTLQVELQATETLLGSSKVPQLVFLLAGSGETRASPEEGSFELNVLGQSSEVREIGGEIYTHEPSEANLDGGRPWVRSPAKGPSSALVLGPTGLGDGLGGSAGSFSSVVELLNVTSAVQETGPAIVDDQPVIEFTATIDPIKLTGVGQLLSNGGVAESLQKRGGSPPTSQLELFLSSAGLPVRIRFTLHASSTTVTVTSDTLALEVPVEVHAPPTGEVIGRSQLEALQKKRRRRAEICSRVGPKRLTGCHAVGVGRR